MGFVESISELIHHAEEPPVVKKGERKLRVIGEHEGHVIFDRQHDFRERQVDKQIASEFKHAEEEPPPAPDTFEIPQ